jgi:two-component system, sensor histidine kinase and response regulator
MRLFGTSDLGNNLNELQNRISLIFSFFAGILMIILGLSDWIMELDPLIIKAKLAYSIPFLAGFWVMRKYGHHQKIVQFLIFIGLILVSFNYTYNDGIKGPTFYTVFIFVVVIAILIKERLKLAWMLFSLVVYSVLFIAEVYGWIDVQLHYNEIQNLFWDHLVTIWWTGIFTFLGINVFIKNYRAQNKHLELIQAEKEFALQELAALNAKKNQLIALLSHDLKSPIGTLSTTLELVEKGDLEKDELEVVFKELKLQSFHLNKVLSNTLSWVMTEMDMTDFEMEKIQLGELNEEMKETMEGQAFRKNQTIETSLFGADQIMELETNEIKIILKNLLDNAIKFSPAGSVIDLNLYVTEKYLRWEVENIGKAIPKEKERDLFNFKVKTSYGTQHEKGTGIGLPLCKKIADQLGMMLGHEDKEGKNVFFLQRNFV